jgi:hypothetical protein
MIGGLAEIKVPMNSGDWCSCGAKLTPAHFGSYFGRHICFFANLCTAVDKNLSAYQGTTAKSDLLIPTCLCNVSPGLPLGTVRL